MNVALGAIAALSLGIALLYKRKGYVSATATFLTGVGLYALTNSMINKQTAPTSVESIHEAESKVAIF